MAVPDRTDLTDCQDELHRLVRDMNRETRRVNDLEQQLFVHASALHNHCKSKHSTFTYCDNDCCRDACRILNIERRVSVKESGHTD